MPNGYMCYFVPKKTFFSRYPMMSVKALNSEEEVDALEEAKEFAEKEKWQGYTVLKFNAERIFSTLDQE